MPPKRVTVRLMVPFSLQCERCEGYIYQSTKFNARKTTTKEQYLGIPIYEFEFRCSSCSAPISFRTDPQSRGYKIVAGARELSGTAASPDSATQPPAEARRRAPKPRVHKLPRPKPRKHLLEKKAD